MRDRQAASTSLAGVPAAGLWTGLVLILAVAQLPPLIVMGHACMIFDTDLLRIHW